MLSHQSSYNIYTSSLSNSIYIYLSFNMKFARFSRRGDLLVARFKLDRNLYRMHTADWSKLEIVLYTLFGLSCPTELTKLYLPVSTFLSCSAEFTRLIWITMACVNSLIFPIHIFCFLSVCLSVTHSVCPSGCCLSIVV